MLVCRLLGSLDVSPQVNNRRFMWNLFHHWSGRLALVLAIVNVYLGLHLSNVSCSLQ